MASYDSPELPQGVNVLSPASLPGSTGVSFAAPVSTRARSNVQIGFAHILDGRDEWKAARCLRAELGLPVERARDVLHLDLELLTSAIERAEAAEAKRVSDIRAPRLALHLW